jgi:signal transduction histidine kinase
MRLADFILESTESILAEWEVFARRIWPAGGGGGAAPDPAALRDHARDILRATAWDMKSPQTAAQQSDKSRGERAAGAASGRVDGASDAHAVGRVRSGFDLMAVVAEYRALRASVIRLWRDSGPDPDLSDVDDLTRFNESIDQSLTESIRAYTHTVDRTRLMFLAILGHDLRNPLNTVSMSADVLGGDDDLDAAARRKAAAGISTAVTAMGDMVRDLLDFAASGLGETMPLTPAPTDLGAVCRDVVAEAAAAAAHAARPLRLDATGDLAGEWDAARLRQVVSNLIGNALQHGSGPVDVRAAPDPTARSGGAGDDSEGGAVVLAVRNGGPPIPPDDLSTIFDPLVRGTSAAARRQRRPGSIGLGLYIAREVATAHGGTIGVASTAEAGTVFTVRLPRRRPGRA